MTSPTIARAWLHTERFARWQPIIVRLLLFAAIGVEIMALATWLPETLRVWLTPEEGKLGDFTNFYNLAESSTTLNQYSAGLTLLLRPLTRLDMLTAFQVYTAINVAALLAVAYLAQRPVRAPEARVAVFLAVLALPQAHWALRMGHFVPVLALLALSGFLLMERRPLLAGVCFALLALKPQYLPIPLLYLLWTRNWRAVLGAAGTLTLLTGAGLVAVGSTAFFAQLENLPRAPLDHSVLYVPVQQAWQYSWQGFLISAGIDPNPLLTVDLLLLSLAAVVLVWATRERSVGKVAAALGMLLLAPFSTFYNWALIAVAGALLLRANVRPKYLIPIVLVLGAMAMAATQKATPFPTFNLLGPGGTYGLYWVQPFALCTVFLMAIAGRRKAPEPTAEPPEDAAPMLERIRGAWRAARAGQLVNRAPKVALWTAVAVLAMGSGYVVSAYVSQSGPFHPGPFARHTVLRALPDDFPAPPDATIEHAGRGSLLPYQVNWRSTQPLRELASYYTERLSEGGWELMLVEPESGLLRIRTAHFDETDNMDGFAELRVSGSETAVSNVTLEFLLLPTSKVPGYERWLADKDAALASDVAGISSPGDAPSP